ncbi:MAG: hypothetical protein ACJ790_07390 [Myxococcaceae bacterium]
MALFIGTQAHAELNGAARFTALAGFDTNALRDYDTSSNGLDLAANLLGDFSGQWRGEAAVVQGDYSVGARKFIRFPSEDLLVQAATLEAAYGVSENASVGVIGTAKDRRDRGESRDYSDFAALGYVDFYPDPRLDLRLRGGAHRFIYQPHFSYSFGAPEGGASLSWRFDKRHSMFVFGEYGDRTYSGFQRFTDGTISETSRRHDSAISAGAGYEFKGGFRFRIDYAYFELSSNSFGETNIRHRVSAMFATRLFWRVNLIAQGALQLTRYPDGVFLSPEIVLVQDEENSNSISVKLVRPITDRLDAELRYALYQYRLPLNDLAYLRQVGWVGLSFRL